MGTTYRLTHCFQGQGGTTRDMYCNQFYFYSNAHVVADVETWGPTLASKVHQMWVSGTPSISYFYSQRATGNLGITKIYEAGVAGSPIYQIPDSTLVPSDDYLSGQPGDQTNLPEEVAVCLSYEAIHTGGDLPRRRGRIYLGPLNVQAIGDPGGGAMDQPARVSDTLRNNMLAGAYTLQDIAATDDFEWRVFSTMDGFAFKIVRFSVDDAFDTVRGRGTAPSSRISLDIA